MKKIKILFFTPFAGRTGSEVSIFNLVKKLDKRKYDIQLFSLEKGELLDELSLYFPTHHNKIYNHTINGVFNKIKTRLNLKTTLEKRILRIHNDFKPDFWYLNTMILEDIVNLAVKYKIPFCVHFHELISQYGFLRYDSLKNTVQKSFFTIGCSKKVCENLMIMGSKRVFKQYECIDTELIDKRISEKAKINDLKTNENVVIIGMSGQRIDRKGLETFVKMAIHCKNESYMFLWLGNSKNSGYEYYLDQLIKFNDLNNIKIIHPRSEQYYSYFDSIDIFFLTSVEDPFPLVMLEAIYLNKYIISFNSGGAEELIPNYPGTILNNHDINQISELLRKLTISKEYKIEKRNNSGTFEYSSNNQIKLFEEILKNYEA